MTTQLRRFAALVIAAAAVLGLAVIVAAAPAGARTVPSCKGALLKYTHSRAQGAAGHGFVTVRFRNISQSTCSLRGFPGLDALKKNGHVLKHAKRSLHGQSGAHKVRTIVLKPNRVASAAVEWSNVSSGGGNCKFSHSIAVTAPNTSRTVHFKVHVSNCQLLVHPVVHGKTGQP
jgi:hypothetical protein